MKQPFRAIIDATEFQSKVLEYISSYEIDEMIDHTVFKDDPQCRAAVVHGMCIAAMLTSRCDQIYVTADAKDDEKPTKNWIFNRFGQV